MRLLSDAKELRILVIHLLPKKTMKPIISVEELVLLHNDDVVLIDARSGADASAEYKKFHLRGAVHMHLEFDLAMKTSNAAQGGRHPLPTIETFADMLGEAGVTRNSRVIIYDDKNGANAAARLWWMLRAIGHTTVQVIDGGMEHALKAGFPADDELVKRSRITSYKTNEWKLPVVTIDEVDGMTKDENYVVVDVRSRERYRGEVEPIDLVAGHIPKAINIPFTENLDGEGKFKSPLELKQKFELALHQRKQEQVVVHCGSGVTACHTILAMNYAGMDFPNLYVGSWSEWSRAGKEIAKGE